MKKKLYITRAIKITALLLIVVLFSLVLQSYVLVHYDGNRMRLDGYYLEEKNSLDVVFIGASDIYASFAPGLAYEKFGFTSYSYATASSTAGAAKTMLKEVMRTQNPQKIVIEVNAFLYGFDNDSKISSVRNYIDNVPLNENKIEYLQSGAIPEGEEEIEYYLPLIKYHSTWNDYPEPSGKYLSQIITQHMDGSTKLKGYRTQTAFCKTAPGYPCINNTLARNDKTLSLLPEYEAKLRDLLEYCKEQELDVLFIRTPHMVDKSTYGRFKRANAVGKIIREYGFDYVNFERDSNTLAYTESDYYNIDHLNFYGSAKFTEYLGSILTEKYGVKKSELSEKQKKNWDTAAEYYHKLYDYADKYTNTEYKETGHIQTLEENKTVMGYIDNFAEKGEIPKAKVTPTNPSEEPEI